MPAGEAATITTQRPPVRCGLVGRGIQLSRTPRLHEAEGAALGLTYEYRLFDMDEPGMAGKSLADVVDEAERAGFAGLNVTYPYKIEVLSLLDDLSENARRAGAVNTVVFRDGKRRGHNTDLWGFAEGFRRTLGDAARNRVLLVGAGGAGLAVAMALCDLGVGQLAVHDAEPARAATLVDRLCAVHGAGRAVAITTLTDPGPLNGIVNATPMGMAKLPGMAVPEALLTADLWVADIVYFPLETALLASARAKGCRVLTGEGMAVFQAVRAFELFTGLTPDSERMAATFRRLGA